MGAGDSFIAGFLYGILNGLNVQDSMEAGAQNSAVTIGYQRGMVEGEYNK